MSSTAVIVRGLLARYLTGRLVRAAASAVSADPRVAAALNVALAAPAAYRLGSQAVSFLRKVRAAMPKRQRTGERASGWSWGRKARRSRALSGGEQLVTFRRTYNTTLVSATGNTGGSIAFQINSVINADIVSMFEWYKISKISLKIFPRVDTGNINAQGTAAAAVPNSVLLYTFDKTDTAVPSGMTDLMTDPNCKTINLPGGQCRNLGAFSPTVLHTAFHIAPSSKSWISTAELLVNHLGFKWWMYQIGAVGTTFDVFVTYTIKCKSIK